MKEFDPGESASIVSVTDRVRPLALGMAVSSVHFLKDLACFVGAEENIAIVDAAGEISQVPVHGGAVLCAASDGKRIVTGGDDGKLVALNAKGEVTLLATDAKRRWIDNVALHPDGAFAWSAGKTAFVRSGKSEEKSFDAPTTVGGLAFAPKGLRCGFPIWRQPQNFYHGPARISASPSVPTTNFWSPPCTSRRCMAGGSPITATCA
jgi:WD40 repeat protein